MNTNILKSGIRGNSCRTCVALIYIPCCVLFWSRKIEKITLIHKICSCRKHGLVSTSAPSLNSFLNETEVTGEGVFVGLLGGGGFQ